MATFGVPYILEDRTGDLGNTEFDELYDRMFFGVSCTLDTPGRTRGAATLKIYELGSRSSTRGFSTAHFGRDPAVIIDFGPGAALGTILFVEQSMSMPMGHWIRKAGPNTKSVERKFKCSDDQEYRWTHAANAEAEWVCTTSSGYLAAQYKLRAPEEPKYPSSSGNMFTVYESYGHIATELLASLTIVRHIHRYNLNV
ncbi:hypothetical protein DFH11DRAFT_1543106 [Phellopilus nigrolimitatus]|nr:hypothetical protein DFH11DRAFT_1543106 [Phellopilus nigrolimitatus]